MADKSKAVVENPETGDLSQVELSEDVTKQAVDLSVRAIAPVLREFGESIGSEMRDAMEASWERVAKAIEEGRPVNEDALQRKHNIALARTNSFMVTNWSTKQRLERS